MASIHTWPRLVIMSTFNNSLLYFPERSLLKHISAIHALGLVHRCHWLMYGLQCLVCDFGVYFYLVLNLHCSIWHQWRKVGPFLSSPHLVFVSPFFQLCCIAGPVTITMGSSIQPHRYIPSPFGCCYASSVRPLFQSLIIAMPGCNHSFYFIISIPKVNHQPTQ